ncbi:MAG: hypothetical protein R2751_07810 [Bacteroidales bacterium]
MHSLPFLAGCQTNQKTESGTGDGTAVHIPDSNGDYYQKISPDNGLVFKHSIGDHHLDNLVETVGGGAVFLDYDQDGYMDLYMSNGSFAEGLSTGERPHRDPKNQLFRNLGNGGFADVTTRPAWDTKVMAWA